MRFFEIFDKKKVVRFAQMIAIAILGIALIVITAMNAGFEKGVRVTEERYAQEALQREIEERAIEEQRIIDLGIVSEAEACARVLYGTAKDNCPADQMAVVWCIINRCENANYPNTIEEVCAQPQQFMGYSDENPIIGSMYEIAYKQLEIWHNNEYRPITPDYIFLSWSESEVTLRTTFEELRNTRYWTPER